MLGLWTLFAKVAQTNKAFTSYPPQRLLGINTPTILDDRRFVPLGYKVPLELTAKLQRRYLNSPWGELQDALRWTALGNTG